jgi:cytidine deaminase
VRCNARNGGQRSLMLAASCDISDSIAVPCESTRRRAIMRQRPTLPMNVPDTALEQLMRSARAAAQRAYAPYSAFAVGAAVLASDGTVHVGANVENASYGLSMCAERAAIFNAVAQGATEIAAVAVYTPTAHPTPPCGACRQVIAEFGPDALVVCCNDDEHGSRRFRLRELLPEAFDRNHL